MIIKTTTNANLRQNPKLPSVIYGTAWKEENTAELVKKAVRAGFRANDSLTMRSCR